MFRFFGILTGSSLLAASMWLVNMTSAQDSPFDAAPATGGRTPSSAAPSSTTPPAASQNPFASPAATAASADAGRRRVEDYLRRARDAQQKGDKAQALLWATAADRTARELKLAFRVGETTPAQFIAQLQGRPASGAAVAESRPAQPAAPANPFADAAATEATPATAAGTPKEQAAELLRQAREELNHEHYAAARNLALQAGSLDVSYDLFEEQPQFILSEVEAATGETVLAASVPASANDPAAEGPNP
ncbi:MAG: hypothetical protein JNG89_17785, partial [Planctomycetaceae bacterium]|nr:hypothetical protein [Planctomycetaceae bacterium]